MNFKSKTFLISIAIPLFVGLLASLLTISGIDASAATAKPPLSPPGWIFPIVWTILYTLMGIASYLILSSKATPQAIANALTLYAAQLVVNFLWSLIFFDLQWYFIAFLVIILLWVLILLTTKEFYAINETAGYLFIPYLLWVTFAAYLTLGISVLNQ